MFGFPELIIFIEPPKQKIFLNNCLLNRNEQNTSQRLYTWNSSLAGNIILLGIILLCLAVFMLKQLYDYGPIILFMVACASGCVIR